MNKQTSIEWLQECLSIHLTHEQQMQFEGLFQQALTMEKEQIVDAHFEGQCDNTEGYPLKIAEQYYNEKFKKFKGGQDE
jgi:hypothetical protein